MKSISFSHTCKRGTNQDYLLSQKLNGKDELFLIVDGMGGYDYGAKAAEIIATSISTYLSTVTVVGKEQIQKGINKANLAIRQFNEINNSKSGATVGGVIFTESTTICFWVGDVRIIHFSSMGEIFFESRDHTFVNDLKKMNFLVSHSVLNKYKHVVSKSVQGDVSKSQISTHTIKSFGEDDIILLCSDGVIDVYDSYGLQSKIKNCKGLKTFVDVIELGILSYGTDNSSMLLINN